MRSLTLKLTLAFLFVGVVGALLMAIVVRRQTQTEFGQFVADRSVFETAARLEEWYAFSGSWAAVENWFSNDRNRPRGERRDPPPVTLVDETGRVVFAGWRYKPGDQLSRSDLQNGVVLQNDGDPIGVLLFPPQPAVPRATLDAVEDAFITRVGRAIFVSAIAAILLALVMGVLLARTISRPVRELTTATRRLADGDLGQQVPVRTQDELGELADSFNQMSTDLAQSTRMRRQMTADIAHDLRTPLSVILGYTEALSDGKLNGSPQIYSVLHKEAGHLNHLVDDLRTLSLADAGELTLVQRATPAKGLLEQTALAYLPLATEQGVTLRVEASEGLPALNVDPERVTQVLGNLVSNALRHTEAGGEVLLSAESTPPSTVTLTVRDTGVGIKPDDLPHIFSRFYRGDRARSQDGSSGLGLAIAKSIVVAHGGEISAESTVGVGTAIRMKLPTTPA